jgi:hypothetical protein
MSQKTFNEDKEYGEDFTDIDNVIDLYGVDNMSKDDVKAKFVKLKKLASEQNNTELLDKLDTHEKLLLGAFKKEEIDETDESREDYNAQNNPNTQIGNWWQNQVLTQSNPIQANKTTDRLGTVQIFDNNHVYMKREQIGITQASQVPYVQGQMNPTLRNVVAHKYTISSKNREHLYKHSPFNPTDASHDDLTTSTDFMLDLPEPLKDVLSIKLDTISIPYSWYNFDPAYGNTCLYCDGSLVEIPGGHYTAETLAEAIQKDASFCFDISYCGPPKGKMDFSMNGPGPPWHTLNFYSEDGSWNCHHDCKDYTKKNQNLGWDLGFKYDVDASGVFKYSPTGGKFSPHYAPNTSGPTIFLLSIDDFNQNNANQQSIYTGQPDKNIKVPSYYNQEDASYSLCVDKKKLLKSNIPRRLTQNQIYSANSIASDNKKENHRSNSQNMSNLFATLTPQTTGLTWGQSSWTNDNPSLQSNKRDYFGPVTLRKLHIKLMDDNGQPINLNGQDWQFSLLIDHVYQY